MIEVCCPNCNESIDFHMGDEYVKCNYCDTIVNEHGEEEDRGRILECECCKELFALGENISATNSVVCPYCLTNVYGNGEVKNCPKCGEYVEKTGYLTEKYCPRCGYIFA